MRVGQVEIRELRQTGGREGRCAVLDQGARDRPGLHHRRVI